MANIDLAALADAVEEEVRAVYAAVDEIALANHARVLSAFRAERVSDFHMRGSTGYGYGDAGRETLDRVWARVFGAEAAIVRTQIVSGTHALALGLFAVCRPGDEVLSLGRPYDTLADVIGLGGAHPGSLTALGVTCREVADEPGGDVPLDELVTAVGPRTKVLYLQRSRGYAWRRGLDLQSMARVIAAVRERHPGITVLVDNCYGEFVEDREPPAVGADLCAGSLIKNPGGGLAPTGGYVAGRADLVELAAERLTAPGLGAHVGCAPEGYRLLFQGLFLAPHIVAEALKGAVFAARLLERLGYAVLPKWDDLPRSDIVQAIRLGRPERILAFCRGLQRGSPVDAHVIPEAGPLPGYADGVVMAAGTFIQGASLELSADAPMREPYVVYLQGGLSRHYARLGVMAACRELLEADR
ncbi:MAG: methionine gamma-lyase family protein [Bacillota bacterium]|nr:methionine gamma-lyase family protein [Bacillota bacterium]